MTSTTGTEFDQREPRPVDLRHLARTGRGQKPAWAYQSADLSLNLVSCTAGQGVGSHVNAEVDVVIVVIDGTGSVDIDGHRHPVQPGQAVIIPKGCQRATRCDGDHFSYLTCHRRRAGLMPTVGHHHGRGETHDDPASTPTTHRPDRENTAP